MHSGMPKARAQSRPTHTQNLESRSHRPRARCVSGCGVGVPHPIGGVLSSMFLLFLWGEGPLGSGFGAFVFNGWCQKVVRKMMVFGGLTPVWGSDV